MSNEMHVHLSISKEISISIYNVHIQFPFQSISSFADIGVVDHRPILHEYIIIKILEHWSIEKSKFIHIALYCTSTLWL